MRIFVGAKIGDGTIIYNPMNTVVDETSLPFIEIGKNCRITAGVVILVHDYSYAILRPKYHCMPRKAEIGDNVFVGMKAIILIGSQIGNNVIIGAVVSGTIPDNVVVAGNSAKIVCTLEDYYERQKNRFDGYARLYLLQTNQGIFTEETNRKRYELV